mmetsp:Transcript_18789/g.56812  ORF Transcript_18789/g.56812 Transcript_18789/m.56812 type:complete len:111 (+) Transcript_18789:119-451(+)
MVAAYCSRCPTASAADRPAGPLAGWMQLLAVAPSAVGAFDWSDGFIKWVSLELLWPVPEGSSLVSLKEMSLTGCSSLQQLPSDIGALKGLNKFVSKGGGFLQRLPGQHYS